MLLFKKFGKDASQIEKLHKVALDMSLNRLFFSSHPLFFSVSDP